MKRDPPTVTSGVRIGTAAMTTKGMTADGFIQTARLIDKVCKALAQDTFTDDFKASIRAEVNELVSSL